MFDNKERKIQRLKNITQDSITINSYNLILGLIIFYGFVVNALIVHFCKDIFINMNFTIFLIAYFVLGFFGICISGISKNPLISFVGYNFVVLPIGALLSIGLQDYGSIDILTSMMITGMVTFIMMIISTIKPQIFQGLGNTLFISLILGILCEIISIFLGYQGQIFDWLFVLLFSAYIGYDWHKAQSYPKNLDNAIDSALDIYLDIINLFIRILSIIGKNKD